MKSEDARFEDDFEKILRWFRNEDKYPLSESLQGRVYRWKSAREFILTMRPLTDSETVEFVMKTHGVSEPQAWRDVRDTKRFFVSMKSTNKEFDRIMLIADVRSLRAKAEMADNLEVSAKCNETLRRMGVAEGEQEESAVSKNIELLIDFNPALIGAKPIPNVLGIAAKYIGEEQARRELMMDDDIL